MIETTTLLKLREKWVLNATSLTDLFRYTSLPEFSRDVAREVHESHGQHLLLVLDGFDEVSHSFHEDSVIIRAFYAGNSCQNVPSFSLLDHQPRPH